jgi:hyperosmotically inducible protein
MKRHLIPALICAAGLSLAAPLSYADTYSHDTVKTDESSQPVKDAYLHGKIISAYAFNPHVSAYDIDVKVDNGVATLNGAVDSDIERDLAVEIARGIDGVNDVHSNLAVKAGSRETARLSREKSRRTVGQTLDDAGTTAAIKTKLLANKNTSGLKINVDTKNNVVTLTGNVASGAEADLAEHIARNSADVIDVRNELSVAKK